MVIERETCSNCMNVLDRCKCKDPKIEVRPIGCEFCRKAPADFETKNKTYTCNRCAMTNPIVLHPESKIMEIEIE